MDIKTVKIELDEYSHLIQSYYSGEIGSYNQKVRPQREKVLDLFRKQSKELAEANKTISELRETIQNYEISKKDKNQAFIDKVDTVFSDNKCPRCDCGNTSFEEFEEHYKELLTPPTDTSNPTEDNK